MRRYLAAVLLLFGNLIFPAAAAQEVRRNAPLPSEVMLLHPRGFTVLGYGTMDGNVLRLEVLDEVGEFVLLLIAPSGAVEQFDGSQEADGTLRLRDADDVGVQMLEHFFGARNIELIVVGRSRVAAGDNWDDRSDRPGDGAEADDDDDDDDDDD